jgi:acetyl esterase/lipase
MPWLKSIASAVATWPILIVGFALAGGCASTVKPDSALDVVYPVDTVADRHLQTMDIYSPPTGKDHPVVLMIHGGGWTSGDKADPDVVNNKMPWFVSQGYVFISMNYRLRPAALVRDQVLDVAMAMQYIYRNILRYRGDPTHILLMGHGSGAYLAAIVATDKDFMQSRGMDPKEIPGVVLLDPQAMDLPSELPMLQESDLPLYRTYLSVFGQDADPTNSGTQNWTGLSPLHYLQESGVEIPYLIAVSSDDDQGPDYIASQLFVKSLIDAKIPVSFKHLEYLTHATISSNIGSAEDARTTKETLSSDVAAFLANPAGFASGAGLPQATY